MLDLPPWARPYLNDGSCPYCNHPRSINDVVGVGVRELVEHGEDESGKLPIGLCFECYCSFCGKSSFTVVNPDEVGITPIKILDEIRKAFTGKFRRGTTKIKKSAISKKELDEAKRILKDVKNHEDFMREIGIDESMISEHQEDQNNDTD